MKFQHPGSPLHPTNTLQFLFIVFVFVVPSSHRRRAGSSVILQHFRRALVDCSHVSELRSTSPEPMPAGWLPVQLSITIKTIKYIITVIMSTSNHVEQEPEPVSPAAAVVEVEMDDEGLRVQGYDVVIVGTNLVHSIVASACARAGKSVLHCDGNDFYGETDTVFSLDGLIQWSSKHLGDQDEAVNTSSTDSQTEHGLMLEPMGTFASFRIHSASHSTSPRHALLAVGTEVVTPFGQGVVEAVPTLNDSYSSLTNNSLAIRLKHWTLATGKSPMVYVGPPPISVLQKINILDNLDSKTFSISKYYADELDIIPLGSLQYQQLTHSSVARSFALDLTPSLLFAQGIAVQGLVQSSVSDYLDFKSMMGLYFLSQEAGCKFKLSPVPSSKGDIFSTKLLSPLEKRKLMKFLQLALDFAVSIQGQKENRDGTSDVETHTMNPTTETLATAETKSQSVPSSDTNSYNINEEKVTSLNERELHMGRSLYRPQNKAVNTSDLEVLYQCFQNDMTFDSYLETKHGLSKHLRDIVIYAMALSSSSPREEYSVQSGMMDLSKHLLSLGRFGSTGFLTPMHGAGEIPQAFCRSAAVHGATYLLRRKPKRLVLSKDRKSIVGIELYPDVENSNETEMKSKDTFIQAKNIVIPSNVISFKTLESHPSVPCTKKWMIRRISILRNKLIPNGDDSRHAEQRHVIIIPPHTFDNEYPIHGIVLDESAQVAPWSIGYIYSVCVLHLSTVVDTIESTDHAHKSLERAVQILTETQSVARDELSLSKELYHFAFSYMYGVDNDRNRNDATTLMYQGLFESYWQGESMTMDSAFDEAEEIFHRIYPDHDFLSLSDDLAAMIHERQLQTQVDGDEDNDLLL